MIAITAVQTQFWEKMLLFKHSFGKKEKRVLDKLIHEERVNDNFLNKEVFHRNNI